MYVDPALKKNIKGKVVKGFVALDVGDGEFWPSLEFTDGSFLVVQCDPEGNGPGFMQLEKDGKNLGCAGGN